MPTLVTIRLSDDERAHVQTFVHRGRANARTLLRAHVLLKLDAGWSDAAIGDAFAVGASTIWRVQPSGSDMRPEGWTRCCTTNRRSGAARR